MTPEPLPDTWNDRDLPVLREIVRGFDASVGASVQIQVVEESLGMSRDDVQRAGIALQVAGLVQTKGSMQLQILRFHSPTAEARRLVGSWPSTGTALDRMIAALEAIAASTDDEDTRTRARKVLDGLAGAGKTIGLSVATAAITGQIPGQ